MTTIITITAEPVTVAGGAQFDYSSQDRILQNIMNHDYEIFYSGQNQGKEDYKLTDSVRDGTEFRVYYRRTSNSAFIFLGRSRESSTIKERVIQRGTNATPEERLQIRLVIRSEQVVNQEIPTEYEGSGKFKKAVLEHSQFPIRQNLNLGFYKINDN